MKKNSIYGEDFEDISGIDSVWDGSENWRNIGKDSLEIAKKNPNKKDILVQIENVLKAFSTVAELNNSQSSIEATAPVVDQSATIVAGTAKPANEPESIIEPTVATQAPPVPPVKTQEPITLSSSLEKKIDRLENKFGYDYFYSSDELREKQARFIRSAHNIMRTKLPTYEDFIDFATGYQAQVPDFNERVYFIADLVYLKKNAAWFIPYTNINIFNDSRPWLILYDFINFIEAVKRL